MTDTCPVCEYNILKKDSNLRVGVNCFGSVHTKCENCKTEIVCGLIDRVKEKYVIITKNEYKELVNERPQTM